MPPAAIIIGDSQAQGAGAQLQAALAAKGYGVKRWSQPGASSAEVAAIAKAHASEPADLVVVFSGSTAGGAPAAAAVDKAWPKAHVVWYGSSPATIIGDPKVGKAVWGATDPLHWFEAGADEGADREKRNKVLPGLLPPRFAYIDWRTLTLPDATVQPSGVVFPTQPDGIHVAGATAKSAFAAPNWPNVAATGLQGDEKALLAVFVIVLLWLYAKG